MQGSELEGDEDKDFKMKDLIKKMPNYDGIFKRWEMASKMRQWINENKKELIERIKKDVETENASLDEEAKDQIADEKFNEELKTAYNKIIEKSEFIVRLKVPGAYLAKD